MLDKFEIFEPNQRTTRNNYFCEVQIFYGRSLLLLDPGSKKKVAKPPDLHPPGPGIYNPVSIT